MRNVSPVKTFTVNRNRESTLRDGRVTMRALLVCFLPMFIFVYGNEQKDFSDYYDETNVTDYDEDAVLEVFSDYFEISLEDTKTCLSKTERTVSDLIDELDTAAGIEEFIDKLSCFYACGYQSNGWLVGNQLQLKKLLKRDMGIPKNKYHIDNRYVVDTCGMKAKSKGKPCEIVKEFELCVMNVLGDLAVNMQTYDSS